MTRRATTQVLLLKPKAHTKKRHRQDTSERDGYPQQSATHTQKNKTMTNRQDPPPPRNIPNYLCLPGRKAPCWARGRSRRGTLPSLARYLRIVKQKNTYPRARAQRAWGRKKDSCYVVHTCAEKMRVLREPYAHPAFSRTMRKKRNERRYVGGVLNRSRNGASPRTGLVDNGRMTKASNK